MRKDVREFIRRLEAAGLTVESTPGHYNVLRDGKPLRKTNGMPFTLPFSPVFENENTRCGCVPGCRPHCHGQSGRVLFERICIGDERHYAL